MASSTITRSVRVSEPESSKSEPVAMRTPSTDSSFAENGIGSDSAAKVPTMFHQSAGTNAMISRSRSTMRRVATLWTRPAESPGPTFFHITCARS